MDVYLFRYRDKNAIPTQRAREGKTELELMRFCGLIKRVNFQELSGQHIRMKINEEFANFLQGREWILLSRIVVDPNNPDRVYLSGKHIFPANLPTESPSWAFQQMYSENPNRETVNRMYIAADSGIINISRELVERFAESEGKTVEELGLRGFTDELNGNSGMSNILRSFGASTSRLSGASTSGLSSQRTSDLAARNNSIFDVSPSSSPQPVRRGTVAAQLNQDVSGIHRSLRSTVPIIYVPSDESDAEDVALENSGASEIANHQLPAKRMRVGNFPDQEENAVEASVEQLRKQLCVKVTGREPMFKSNYVFEWIPGNDNVQNWIDFHYAHGPNLADGGRPCIQIEDATDLDGPYKEVMTKLGQAFLHYRIPDLGITLFEQCATVVLISSDAIVTEAGHSALRAFGHLLRDSVLHGAPFVTWLNSSVFRYLLNLPIEVNDIFSFSPGIGSMIDGIMSGVGPVVLENEEALRIVLQCAVLLEHGREQLCRLIAEFELVHKRAGNLKYVYEGLVAGKMYKELMAFRSDWKRFEPQLYRAVMEGKDLLEQFKTLNEDTADDEEIQTMAWLDDIILEEFSQHERKQLLRFITGSYMVPATPKIEVSFTFARDGNRRPTATTCTNKLTLPSGCMSKEQLLEGHALLTVPASMRTNGKDKEKESRVPSPPYKRVKLDSGEMAFPAKPKVRSANGRLPFPDAPEDFFYHLSPHTKKERRKAITTAELKKAGRAQRLMFTFLPNPAGCITSSPSSRHRR
ncbi:uncharacterized protein LOC129589172 [Paramacrobiotus metropolitanus]|uniref:uncharacterized protein LOC129589172 n=1 Tax=Paramacrobiotus metropolitanus TaxID=2943436 RepID=UPI0024461A08|nr:uncharacterized protein LOC129589172 [Paramacrobiotus metropolitanus]